MTPQDIQRIIESLDRAPGIIIPLVREAPAAILKTRPEPGKWSIHEQACHLAEVDPVMLARLDLMLSDPSARITPYDPGTHDPDALLRVDLEDALERLATQRARLVGRARKLSAADWARAAEHPEFSRYSVFVMLRHLTLHDLFHGYRIEQLVLSRTLGK